MPRVGMRWETSGQGEGRGGGDGRTLLHRPRMLFPRGVYRSSRQLDFSPDWEPHRGYACQAHQRAANSKSSSALGHGRHPVWPGTPDTIGMQDLLLIVVQSGRHF